MTPLDSRTGPPAPAAPAWLRRLATSNPFYVVSAGLFLYGLRLSVADPDGEVEAWALMAGLAGYTLLLAVTGCLLVRFGNVWDDVRTVLLLVVLLFLATAVTFDGVVAADPARGAALSGAGLLVAVLTTEGVLRGTRLRFPAGFRVPYYLLLGLFFLYPLALTPLLDQPRGEALMWGLWGFAPAAGVAFLGLLPAARRGPTYTRDNGSPWPWPLYPWVLFGGLALAVPARAFLLCWSLHPLQGMDYGSLIFGPYFVIPFGLAVAAVLLEGALAVGSRGAVRVALAAPIVLAGLGLVGHRPDPIYGEFLDLFAVRLGGSPTFLGLLLAVGFALYAAARRVSGAPDALSVAMALLAVVGPATRTPAELTAVQPVPLLAAAGVQLVLGLRRRAAGRCLLGAGGLAAAAAVAVPDGPDAGLVRAAVGFHLLIAAALGIGVAFPTGLGLVLRRSGVGLLAVAAGVAVGRAFGPPTASMVWGTAVYPLGVATVLLGYGWAVGDRVARLVAVSVGAGWGLAAGGRGYLALRHLVVGLDAVVMSLAVFGVAFLVSLGKSGVLPRWFGRRATPDAPGSEASAGAGASVAETAQSEAAPRS